MADLPPLGALRFEEVRERRSGEEQQTPVDRRAVAAREVSAGSLLFPPALLSFEAVLTEPALLERCSGTFLLPNGDGDEEGNQKPPLLRCSRCKVARYATAAAQRRDWKGRAGTSSSSFSSAAAAAAAVGLHSRECEALRAFAAEAAASGSGSSTAIPPASIRLAARIFWKQAALFEEEAEEAEQKEKGKKTAAAAAEEAEAAPPPPLSWWSSPKAVATLRHHFSTLPDDRKVSVAAAAAAARIYMFGALTEDERRRAKTQEEEEEAEEEEDSSSAPSCPPAARSLSLLLPRMRKLAELLSALSCNAHALSDASQGTLSSYGVGLYPPAAMLNHSCWPSAAVVFRPREGEEGGGRRRSGGGGGGGGGEAGGDGRRLEARALRRLREGEEATISYIDLCCPRPERRKALLEGYSFDIDDDNGRSDERLQHGEEEGARKREEEEEEEDSPVAARWQGSVPFPPGSSLSSRLFYPVSATLHEARPRAATEASEEARERRAPLESVCLGGGGCGDGGGGGESSGGIAWIEEEEEEEEEEEDEEKAKTGGRRRRCRRRKTVKVLAWGGTFAASGGTSALSFYATASATAALAAALSSEALAAKETARALSLAQAGREALLKAAAAAAATNPHLSCPCPSTSSSFVAARLDDALTHAAISRGEIRCALEAARRAVPALHLACAPRGHPPRAFALATLAKLESAALGNGVGAEGGGGGNGISVAEVRRAAEAAQQAADEIGICFPGSERELEFKIMAEGLRAEVEAAQRMR